MRYSLVVLAVVLAALLGCGTAPKQTFLRVGPAPCGQAGVPAAKAEDLPRIRLRQVESLPGLDRTAVLFARQGALSPSGQWFWEGSPQELVLQGLELALGCSDELVLVGTQSARARPELDLRVDVLAFEVQRGESDEFVVRLALSAWAHAGREQRASNVVQATVPVANLTPEGVALAARTGLADAVDQTLAWVRANLR